MKINVTLIDPAGFSFSHLLYDSVRLFSYTMQSLGHDVWSTRNTFDPRRLNVIFGAHHFASAAEVQELVQSGVRYVVIQTEVLKDRSVNHGDKARFEQVTLPLLQGAVSVWEGISYNLEELAKLGIKGRFWLGGYHQKMEEITPKKHEDIDFLFYGSITAHRRQMLNLLIRRGHHVVTIFDDPAIFRNDYIARSKVLLAPRQTPESEHLPWGRVCYLLNNTKLVAIERCEHDFDWLEPCFSQTHAPTNEWVDLCESLLERPDRLALAAEGYERFRQLPMTEQVAPLLEGL